MNACVRVNGSSVMPADEFPAMGNTNPKTLVEDQFWGDRYGLIEDPFGHRWSVATPKRQVTIDEIREAAHTVRRQ
jgi:PhnB protein